MSLFGKRMQDTADRLIDAYGADALYTFVTAGPYDPAIGQSVLSTFDHPVKAVVGSAGRELKDGAWVEREGLRFNLAAKHMPGMPTPNDQLVFKGVTYLVTAVNPVYAADVVASFDVFAKVA